MRTTLDIADDVLLAAKDAARRNRCSVGAVISELARRTLESPNCQRREPRHPGLAKLGIEPLPLRGGVVTNELISELLGDAGY